MQKLIAVASLSVALLCGLHAAPALAETTDTSTVSAPESTSKSNYPKLKEVDGKVYFYTEDGTILKSQWITYGDDKYYVDETGAAASGFYTTPDGKTWYFNSNFFPYARYGLIYFDQKTPDNQYVYYYVDKDNGLIKNNWVKTDKGWSWAGADGRFIEGWFTDPDGKTWYLTRDFRSGPPVITEAAPVNGKLYFFDTSTGLLRNSWVNRNPERIGIEGTWYWAGPDGAAISGWFKTPGGKTWYADPEHYNRVVMGGIDIDGKYYFFDYSNGLVTHGWIEDDGEWAWIETVGSVYSGWKHMPNGKWFYFDENGEFPLLKKGVFTISSGTYYVDVNNGMTANDWVQLPNGGWAWAQSSGAFVSGWYTTPNGKTWYFDPSDPQHPALIGDAEINGQSYYFDSGYGLLKNGWVHRADGSWSWAGESGALQSGWKHMPNGKWFYFDPKDPYHRMLVGVIQTSSGTYYIDESAGMTANSWVQLPEGGWAWAQSSGAFASGWFTTPNGKTWYFDPAKPSHPAYTGEHTIDGKDYYFDESYGLARNQWITRPDGVRCWAGPDGVLTEYKR
jgi:erfK/ybiS/ycfS/ynhG family protein